MRRNTVGMGWHGLGWHDRISLDQTEERNIPTYRLLALPISYSTWLHNATLLFPLLTTLNNWFFRQELVLVRHASTRARELTSTPPRCKRFSKAGQPDHRNLGGIDNETISSREGRGQEPSPIPLFSLAQRLEGRLKQGEYELLLKCLAHRTDQQRQTVNGN